MPTLDCAPNLRSVAGMVGRTGQMVAHGRLFRADAIIDPSPNDQAILANLGLSLVFDLRSAQERSRVPGDLAAISEAKILPIDMLAHIEGEGDPFAKLKAKPDWRGADSAMQTLYAGFPAALHGQLRMLVEAMVETGGAVLIHCTAGKDRTGFAVAILLAAIGVSLDVIMADYLKSAGRSNSAAREATQRLLAGRLGFELSTDALDRLMTVDESYLSASFDQIDRRFGGVESYLSSAGLGVRHLSRLEQWLSSHPPTITG